MPLLLLAVGTTLHAYFLAGGTARTLSHQDGKRILALILVGIPLVLGVMLLDPADWRAYGPALTPSWVPATAFWVGIVFVLLLVGSLLATWNTGGLGRLARLWHRLWTTASLWTSALLIILGLEDNSVRLVVVGVIVMALLVMGFIGPMASKALARRLRQP